MTLLANIILTIHFSVRYVRPFFWTAFAGILLISGSLWLFQATNLKTSPVGWEKSFNLTPPQIALRGYSFASKGRYMVVVGEGERAGAQAVFVQVSIDGGGSFSQPVIVSSKVVKQDELAKAPKSPFAAISSTGSIYVVWQEYDEDNSTFVVHGSTSNDFGDTWSAPERLDFGGTDMNFIPRAYYDDGGELHLFYHAFSDGGFNLFHVYRDEKNIFSKPEAVARLSKEMKGVFFPSVVMYGDYIFVAWQAKALEKDRLTDDIYFLRSLNRGRSFSRPERITTSEASDASPYLIISKGRLFCVYENNDKKSWEIRFTQSGTLGESWDPVPTTVTTTNANCYAPSMTVTDNDELVFFWYDNRDGVNRIFTRRYGLSDSRFSKEIAISEGKDPARHPIGTVVGSGLLAVWEEGGRIRGKFSDISVESPLVISKTHPEGKWVKNSEAVIEWTAPKDESGIAGYASLLSNDPGTNPTVQNLTATTRSETIRSIGDGITYYHLRAIDGAGNYSRTIHYPLRVSRSPLPIPIIESKTHPEGKSVKETNPIFTWQVSDIERVKGFVYKLSKDYPGKPDIFTDKMTISFSDLSEGRYFLRIQGIDRTNTPGRFADYEFIIGKAEAIDQAKYRQFAQQDIIEEVTPVHPKPKLPTIGIDFPKDIISSDHFDIRVNMKIPAGFTFDRLNYEVSKDDKSFVKGSSGNDVIALKGLDPGNYKVSVRGVFLKKGGKRYEPGSVTGNFSVNLPLPESPLQFVMNMLNDALMRKMVFVILFFPLMGLFLTISASSRFVFYMHEFPARIRTQIRVLISSFR
jgi:hypothetical protein